MAIVGFEGTLICREKVSNTKLCIIIQLKSFVEYSIKVGRCRL